MKLNVIEQPPPSLFEAPAEELLNLLEGPTLLHIRGETDPPLFLSVLLHGNETSGWNALSSLLRDSPRPPRSLLVFVGNVEAAAQGVRALANQPDFNRIWKDFDGVEGSFARQLLRHLELNPPFAAVDIHNNTGRNPHYCVLTKLDAPSRALAYLFSDKAVYVEEPDTVLGRAVHDICPTITIEAGPVGDVQSDLLTLGLLRDLLDLSEVPIQPTPELIMHRSLARVHVADGAQFDFVDDVPQDMESNEDLILTSGMEAVNFHPVEEGFEFAVVRTPLNHALRVLDPAHRDVTDQFFEEVHGVVTLRRSVIPAMYTTDHDVIRQDCLCYFMERI